ncbi:hypothetical protein [Elioraea tepidiphila]|uniref:hypothetical protein n=1 Tax=Elioraea tepidiphila TaxID=457934 RepID=UPI00035F2C95|nr:hypothetical protein [Elioraea tepidiphila]
MTERHYLIVPTSPTAQKRVRAAVMEAGGFVILTASSGALVARMADAAKEAITARHDVRHCGGVDIAPRPIRRIRVNEAGNRIGG